MALSSPCHQRSPTAQGENIPELTHRSWGFFFLSGAYSFGLRLLILKKYYLDFSNVPPFTAEVFRLRQVYQEQYLCYFKENKSCLLV